MNQILFIEYNRCSTCRKAKKWLDDHNIDYLDRSIVEDNPSVEELQAWHAQSKLPIKRFFNTSGMKYRELKLKDKFAAGLSDQEAYEILASDGMLVKRPLVISEDFILIGFKEAQWEETLLQ